MCSKKDKATRWSIYSVLLAAISLVACTNDDKDEFDNIPSLRITRDTIWTANKPITIDGTLRIEGATLTILAGTNIRMGENASILIGETVPGALNINGSPDLPVRIIAKSRGSYWRGIHFLKTKPGNFIHGLELRQAGNQEAPAISIRDLNFAITHLKLLECGGNGIDIARASNLPLLSNIEIQAFNGNPIRGDASLLLALSLNIHLATNGGIYLTSGTLNTPRCFFPNYGCPYIVRSEIAIDANEVIFDELTRFEFERGATFNFGQLNRTTLCINKVTFSAHMPQIGGWRGLVINDRVDPYTSYIRNSIFEYGGGSNERGNLIVYNLKGLEVSNSIFRYSAGYGIVLYSSTLRGQDNFFEGNTSSNIKNAR
ncbi:MAG: hypothetical protein ACTTKZ_05680 [Bacteroides sp.]